MRLSDGLVYESEWGVIIRLESENIAFGQIVTWPFLMIANGDRDRVNKIFIKKEKMMWTLLLCALTVAIPLIMFPLTALVVGL